MALQRIFRSFVYRSFHDRKMIAQRSNTVTALAFRCARDAREIESTMFD